MGKFIIEGGHRLSGRVKVQGAKKRRAAGSGGDCHEPGRDDAVQLP